MFALDKARGPMGKSGKALLCEGQIDVIACHEAGISFAVAPLGTAFTPEHARILSRYASRIVLCFDADKAGMVAADRAFRELAPFGKDIYLVNLPAGDDPDSFMKREGKEAFSGMVERARSFFEVRIERARESGLLDDAASSAAFAREMTALLACMSDPVARDLATADVATRMRMAADNLRGAVRMAGRRKGQEQAQSAERKTAEEVPQHPPVKMDRAVAVLCELALQNSRAQGLIVDRIEELLEPMRLLQGGGILKKFWPGCLLRTAPRPFRLFGVPASAGTGCPGYAESGAHTYSRCGQECTGSLLRHCEGRFGEAHRFPDGGTGGSLHGCCQKAGIVQT